MWFWRPSGRDRQEMTGYLSQMNQRLQEATTGLAASTGNSERRNRR